MKLSKLVTESENNGDTFQMYHGGKRWSRLPEEIIGGTKGRYEAGVGIYFTTDYNRARTYAKGPKVVQIANIDKNYKDIKSVNLPINEVVSFVKSISGMKKKNEIISDLKRNAERMNRDFVDATVLNNLVVNWEAGSGRPGIEIANYLVSKGGDAYLERQGSDEYWLVVFNPKIIKSVSVVDPKKVTSDFAFQLPVPR